MIYMEFGEKDIVFDALCGTTEHNKIGKLVLYKEVLRRHIDKGQFHLLAQCYKLVKPAVLYPEFIFSGLNRPLYNDENTHNDREKLIYITSLNADYIWKGGKNGKEEKVKKPKNCIFTVIVSINNKHKGDYSNIFGFIEKWSWCEQEIDGKPINWIDRYDKLIFEKLKIV